MFHIQWLIFCFGLTLCFHITKLIDFLPNMQSSFAQSAAASNSGTHHNPYRKENSILVNSPVVQNVSRQTDVSSSNFLLEFEKKLKLYDRMSSHFQSLNKTLHAWRSQFGENEIGRTSVVNETDYRKFLRDSKIFPNTVRNSSFMMHKAEAKCPRLSPSEHDKRIEHLEERWIQVHGDFLNYDPHIKMFRKTDYISRLRESVRIVNAIQFNLINKKSLTEDNCLLQKTMRRLNILRTLILSCVSSLPWFPKDITDQGVSLEQLISLWFSTQARYLFDVPCLKCYRKVGGSCMKLFFCPPENEGGLKIPPEFRLPLNG